MTLRADLPVTVEGLNRSSIEGHHAWFEFAVTHTQPRRVEAALVVRGRSERTVGTRASRFKGDVAVSETLRQVDSSQRPGRFRRAYGRLVATRAARVIFRHVNWKLDPLLLRLTRGRLASTLVFRSAVLETRGARTGAVRRNAIIYFHDHDRVIIAASNAGSARHPGGTTTCSGIPRSSSAGSL
jgi:F420H(2)-dependent quinone reductase